MKIDIKQAVKVFFQNPSLEMVFIEAIANSMDANASDITIDIYVDALEKQETLSIKITDNGDGFSDERYYKFCKLLNVEEDSHKGIGRLVYLSYFNRIKIESRFGTKLRTFTYDNEFDEDNSDMSFVNVPLTTNQTQLTFNDCSLKRFSSYNSIFPEYLKKRVLEEFYPRLYLLKQEDKQISIKINLHITSVKKGQIIGKRSTQISLADIPTLKTIEVDAGQIKMFETMVLHYSIKEQDKTAETFIITALCIDDRTYNLRDVLSNESFPSGYELIFLLSSTMFNGQVDPSRQILTIKDETLKSVRKIFRDKIAEILGLEIPNIKKRNEQTKESLITTYPHLMGYFEEDEIGFISRSKSIEVAQQKFIRDQKEILEATTLDDKKYDKALELSSRSLAEYILYREKIIGKIESISHKDSEADIHNLILPKSAILKGSDSITSIYNNNLWLLDNKYMTYTTALSERTMKEIINEITQESSVDVDDKRPDIAIIFSDNPEVSESKAVDVVIVELKKRGVKLAKTEEVISQLKQRAVKLLKHYPSKIQRIWFYGIVEFNDEFKLSLKNDGYKPLYSKDSLYYKEHEMYLDLESEKSYTIGTYILSIDAFIKDAKAHNDTFLKILKDGFRKSQIQE